MLRRVGGYFRQNVVGFLALFVALGGTGAYAANSVFSADITDGEVKTADIGNNEVNSADVKDQSLTTFDVSTMLGADVVDNTLTGADVDESTLVGVPDNVTVRSHVTPRFLAQTDSTGPVVQSCNAGEVAIQGGGAETVDDVRLVVTFSRARLNGAIPTEWEIEIHNNSTQAQISFDVRVWAVCLKSP